MLPFPKNRTKKQQKKQNSLFKSVICLICRKFCAFSLFLGNLLQNLKKTCYNVNNEKYKRGVFLQQKVIYINGSLADLNPKSCGCQTAWECSDAIPAVSAFTSLHYVISGKGILKKDSQSFEIKEGDIFIIKRGEAALCSAAPYTPLSYYFVSFDGILASDFEALPAVFSGEKSCFEKIGSVEDGSPKSISLLSSYLFEIYSKYCRLEKNDLNDYVERIKSYIESNYQNDIRIEQISSLLHLSRAYIARIFKQRTGMTVIEYLTVYRLKQAEQFLKSGKSITETAYLCGFGDLSNFSQKFRKYTGLSPRQYKASNK